MMKKERWEVCINRDLSKGINYQFYIRQGKSHITNIIMEKLPNDVCCPVSPISMPEDFCQQLIDELYRSGFRPSEIRYTQNEIEAIKKHLKEEREMRKECRFEPRCDECYHPSLDTFKINEALKILNDNRPVEELRKIFYYKVYVHDICVKCGRVVKRGE